MTRNRFDQASRYAAKLDPVGLLTWLFSGNHPAFEFRGWLDTRTLPFPGDPERTCDTVSWLWLPGLEQHWAIPLEFNLEPDGAMFGRLLVYLGQLWLEQRPAGDGAGRFQVGAIVVNLTGKGQTARDMQMGAMRTCLQLIERDLANEEASAVLAAIAAGSVARSLLPWVPLMRDGGDPGIIQHWIELAQTEPNSQRRGEYGGLARVFAEATPHFSLWDQALKGWNMRDSQVVQEWIAEGEIKTKIRDLLRLLEKRFPPGPSPEVVAAIEGNKNADQLSRWFDAAIDAPSLDEFRRAMVS